jgi:hypothetical protein
VAEVLSIAGLEVPELPDKVFLEEQAQAQQVGAAVAVAAQVLLE